MEAQSEYVHVAHTFLARFGADLHAQSALSNKDSASELRRKFIKSAQLLVGSSLFRRITKEEGGRVSKENVEETGSEWE